MKTIAFRGLLLLVVLCPLLVHAIAPINDKFASASLISGRNTTLKNQNAGAATAEPLDPFIGGVKLVRSVWYRFDAVFSSGNAHVIVAHPGGAARVGVFQLIDADGGQGTLSLSGEVTNAVAGTDTVTFTDIQNSRYYICVEATGLFDITLQQPGQNNDFFADAQGLTGDIGTVFASNLNCTNEGDFPAVGNINSLRAGAWFKWTPTFTGQAGLNTNFSKVFASQTHDTRIFVYTGTALSNLVQVAFDDDSGTNGNSRLAFAATSGATYFIWVGSSNTNNGVFNLEYYANNNPGTFELFAPLSFVSETQGSTATVEVRRHFAGSVAPSVTIASANGTATAGSDFVAIGPSVLSFPAAGLGGNTSYVQSVTVGIVPDAIPEATESFNIDLSAPTLGAQIPGFATTIFIANAPDPVLPGFLQSNYRVKETDGTITLPLQRWNSDGQCTISLSYGTSSDTAIIGTDYGASITGRGLLAGESTVSLVLGIINNGRADGERTFTVSVGSDLSGQAVDGLSSTTVTIVDDEPAIPRVGRIITPIGSPLFGGMADVKVSATGALTGKLIMNRATFAFTGKLNAAGFYSVRVGPAGAQRTLTLQLLSAFNNTYALTLSDNDLGSVASTTTTASSFSALAPCPQAGRYSFGNVVSPFPATLPELFAGAVKVDTLGNATITGKIFDGAAFIAGGGVDPEGNMVTGTTLYAGRGRLSTDGLLPTTISASPAFCTTRLVRPGRANQTAEFPSLDVSVSARIALYTPPPVGSRILDVWTLVGVGNADLTGANFAGTVTQSLLISTANKVTLRPPLSVPSLKLTLAPATGIFTGTVIPPGSPVARPVFGTLFQLTAASFGSGFFLNPTVTPAAVGQIQLRGP